ncbi:MAG: FAD-dependent monooxygenase, partial [Pseudomonadota bacterium]
MSRVEALVVGGGLAGAAAAIVLARAGRSVVLLEKEPSAKPKVCGEFLSASALASLSELGCDAVELGAVPLDTFRMAARGRAVSVALPFQAASVTRAALDEALLAKAARAGATVLRGAAVRTISRDDGGWRADTAHTAYSADSLLLATGKSDLKERRRGTGLHDGMVGLKRYGHGAGATTSIDIALFPGGYCGIQPVEDGRLNVCLAVSAR